ncbi:MAG: Rne/Rng family ribonuclease [Planctomycetota bacterium]
MPSKIIINASDPEERRIAILEDGRLEDYYIDLASKDSYLGNIYKGRVVNIEPSIGAAFVDFGEDRNGFLHNSDLMTAYGDLAKSNARGRDIVAWYQEESSHEDRRTRHAADREARRVSGNGFVKPPPIQDSLRRGQEVLVQITKDGIGHKGPTLSTYISIPGRYLVLMPRGGKCGVSRKISDDKERNRLKRILDEIEPPEGFGFIIRTAGMGRTKKEIEKDLLYLLRLWDVVVDRMNSIRGPGPIYQESDLVIKTIRDLFRPDMDEIVVDDEGVFRKCTDFLRAVMPRYESRVRLFEGRVPIFHDFGIEREIEKITLNKIPLGNGGSIVIDQTEALVAIDVNSGRFKDEEDLEETAYKTNLEAVPEIVRQLRIRDLGGVIIIDFIDMLEEKHRRDVERTFRAAVRKDRARIRIAKMSPFGIIEMTRQRVRPGIFRRLYAPCSYCGGRGHVRAIEGQGLVVLREIRYRLDSRRGRGLRVVANPDVVAYLLNEKRRELIELEESSRTKIEILAGLDFPVEEVEYAELPRSRAHSPAMAR